jgi:hypothetical protein
LRALEADRRRGAELAREIHDLVAAVQAAYATCPPDKVALVQCPLVEDAHQPVEDLVAFELADIIEALRSIIFDVWPTEGGRARRPESPLSRG